MSLYLFDIAGHPIAFRRTWDDDHLYALDGTFLGHLPWKSCDVADASGEYLGSIVGDRLVRRNDAHDRRRAPAIADPGRAVPTGRPGAPLPFDHPYAYDDVFRPAVRAG